ncbi:MAG: hypothetical protein KAQ98_10205 [Bacteriovoracaceae bacterium]|nr:hypothetical protein [Bacteriovoracaceae bacterium]
MALCKFCRKEIMWIKENRKNVPIEMDGTKHDCEEMKRAMKSIRQLDRNSLSEKEIKRYEQAINEKAKKK